MWRAGSFTSLQMYEMGNLVNRTGPDTLWCPTGSSWKWPLDRDNRSEPCFNFELTHSDTCNTWAAFSYVMSGLGGYSSLLSLPFWLNGISGVHTKSSLVITPDQTWPGWGTGWLSRLNVRLLISAQVLISGLWVQALHWPPGWAWSLLKKWPGYIPVCLCLKEIGRWGDSLEYGCSLNCTVCMAVYNTLTLIISKPTSPNSNNLVPSSVTSVCVSNNASWLLSHWDSLFILSDCLLLNKNVFYMGKYEAFSTCGFHCSVISFSYGRSLAV